MTRPRGLFILAYKNDKISKQKSLSDICNSSTGIRGWEGPWKVGIHQV